MPFVMVPVAEEYVYDVMRYLVKLHERTLRKPWDSDAIHEFFAESDEPSRSLMSVIAQASLSGEEISVEEAAKRLGVTVGNLGEVGYAVSLRARALQRVDLWETGNDILTMDQDVAGMIRDAERANSPTP